jgi:hypothetical protein
MQATAQNDEFLLFQVPSTLFWTKVNILNEKAFLPIKHRVKQSLALAERSSSGFQKLSTER